MNKIEQAKKTLRAAGYFTDNLWHVDDVKLRFTVFDNENAQDILESALTNDWIMEQIHYNISEDSKNKGFKELEHEN